MPSTAPSFSAVNTSDQAIGVPLAGRISNAACSSLDPVTRIFMASRSAGFLTSFCTVCDISSQRGTGSRKASISRRLAESARTVSLNSLLK